MALGDLLASLGAGPSPRGPCLEVRRCRAEAQEGASLCSLPGRRVPCSPARPPAARVGVSSGPLPWRRRLDLERAAGGLSCLPASGVCHAARAARDRQDRLSLPHCSVPGYRRGRPGGDLGDDAGSGVRAIRDRRAALLPQPHVRSNGETPRSCGCRASCVAARARRAGVLTAGRKTARDDALARYDENNPAVITTGIESRADVEKYTGAAVQFATHLVAGIQVDLAKLSNGVVR